MKYVITWAAREGGSARESEEAGQRALELFGRWTPESNLQIHQLVGGLDSRTGVCVCETDDPNAIVLTTAYFAPFFNYTVIPVMDLQQTVESFQAATARRG
jgi:hypothetical protein